MLSKTKQRITCICFVSLIYITTTLINNAPEFSYEMAISHYIYLAQGFLSGYLHLSIAPPAALLKLADPYDPVQNELLRLMDVSLYKGQYYLYFGPLPVLTFFIPIKLLTGLYPTESLSILFFLILGFTANFILLAHIKDHYFPHVSENQLFFIGLVMGLSGTTLFLINRPLIYETAIASAYCTMSYAIFFLYRCFHYHFRHKDVFLFSLLAAVTVAGRADFTLACFYLFPVLCIYLYYHVAKQRLPGLLITLLAPAMCIASTLALYNYLRFDSIFEFGQNYQLNILVNTTKAGLYATTYLLSHLFYGTFYYLFQPYPLHALLPFKRTYLFEPTFGIFLIAPFVVFIFSLPSSLYYYYKQKNTELRPLLTFAFILLFVPIIIFMFLISLAGATQRYEMDFTPYLFILAIISLWLLQMKLQHLPHWAARLNRFFLVLGALGIGFGMSLGFSVF